MERQKFLYLNIVPPPDSELNVVDIEAQIEDCFMAAFRAIFKHDKYTPYDDELDRRKITITTEYPTDESAPLTMPQILLSNISFNLSLDTSMGRNFMNYSSQLGVYNAMETEAMAIPYSLSITCMAGKSTSRDLANRLINYICFVYKRVFDDLNLNIMSVTKGATQASAKDPEKLFETQIQIQGSTQWTGNTSYIDISKENVLSSVGVSIQPATK